MIAVTLFWISAVLIAYVHIGYPILIRSWAARRRRPVGWWHRQPTVSIVVVAHDEAARIADRVANLLALDYPKERLEIVVASDGSTDDTVARAGARGGGEVRVVAFGARRGKAAVLNDVVPGCRGEIVVLADARQRFEREALRALVRPLADACVGAVGGELVLARAPSASPATRGFGLYWRLEKSVRLSESRVDSTVGATGAIYAIRRDLFAPIPADTILDDVLIPMRIARLGYRVLHEPAARACDRPADSARQEFVRKVRTLAGNFQLFARERWLLDPFRNRLWFQTVSHKALRLAGPLLLAAAFVSNLALAGRPFYLCALFAQAAFYAAAMCGVLKSAARRLPFVAIPFTVCLLNWATVVAFLRFLTGRQSVTWERAAV